MSYKDISLFEVSLNSFSGEGYKVKFDLNRNLISWNDGYMWNNNFMKAINSDKLAMLKSKLPETEMLDWLPYFDDSETEIEKSPELFSRIGKRSSTPSMWRIDVRFSDGSIMSGECKQNFPHKWDALKDVIEEATECRFRLR